MQGNKKNKLFLLIIVAIVLLGIGFGLLYYFIIDNNVKTDIINTLNNLEIIRFNNIFKNLIIMSLLLITSFFIIGIPLSFFYIFYESFTFGFIFLAFINSFKIKGIIYMLFYLIFNKLIPLLFIIIFIKKIINISRLSIGLFIYKKEITIKEKIIHNFINSLYIIIFVLIYNIILFLISPLFYALLK